MPFDFNQFVNTSQFSDPANYAGFNGQMKSVEEVAQQAALTSLMGGAGGVAPPQSIGEYASQAIAPAQKSFEKTFNNASNAVGQFSQGNFTQGLNAFKGGQNAQGPQQQQQPSKPWDMSTHFGLD